MLKRAGRGQRILIVAFAISILLHLVFAVAYRMPRPRRSSDVETVSIIHRSAIAIRTPQPIPSATPKPHPHPAPSAPKLKPAAHGFAPGPGGSAQQLPTPSPAPVASVAAPTPKPCAGNDLKPAVSQLPPQPDVPNAARAEGTDGTAAVDVRLDEHGEVTGATVSHPTGNSSLDLIAVSMAKAARYTPATHDCRPVAGEYTFSVKFFAW